MVGAHLGRMCVGSKCSFNALQRVGTFGGSFADPGGPTSASFLFLVTFTRLCTVERAFDIPATSSDSLMDTGPAENFFASLMCEEESLAS